MAGPERFKTYGNVFDNFTLRTLEKLSGQGFFTELTSAISLGKEANIFLASTPDHGRIIVKIYRMQNCNFNKMWSYLASDPRYKGIKPQRRQIILAWVQREFRNLLKAREAHVRVPTALQVVNHILLQECIGEPARQMNKSVISDDNLLYHKIREQMRTLYQNARLVHGDLSPFNILIDNDDPVIIDMSQSTARDDPNAMEYLIRDVHNITTFFTRRGLELDEKDLLDYITKDINEQEKG